MLSDNLVEMSKDFQILGDDGHIQESLYDDEEVLGFIALWFELSGFHGKVHLLDIVERRFKTIEYHLMLKPAKLGIFLTNAK